MTTQASNQRNHAERGYHFANCMRHILTKGVDDYAADTVRRGLFVQQNQSLLAGTMLVAMFAFLESTLGHNWIARCGGRQARELECLRFVRNAFVHSNCHVRDLDSYTPQLEKNLREFIGDLKAGKITDDKGNAYPRYMDVSADGVVALNREAIQVFYAITKTVAH